MIQTASIWQSRADLEQKDCTEAGRVPNGYVAPPMLLIKNDDVTLPQTIL